jgi:hypothetical protein
MFFNEDRAHFFNPLSGKYREVVVQCLRLLYQRLYTDLRDYGHALNREQILDIFLEAVARSPVLDGDQDEGRFKTQRELAIFILNRLLSAAWIEKQVDDTTLQSTFSFTRAGRLFTQPFAEIESTRVRTRHRNTRNTRNSLQAFLDSGEVHDLLDAFECSERIISDFTDIIAELEERKRQLVREVEARQLVQHASDEFFDFMEKRFQPDVAVRMSADSVEKYRDEISGLILKIRRKRKEWKSEVEFRLRDLMPDQVVEGHSLLWNLLDGIDARLRNASEVMLPALRRALHSFTQRADIIIRQLSYLAAQQHSDVLDVCQSLMELPKEQQDSLLSSAGERLSGLQGGFVDPEQVRLHTVRKTRVINMVFDDGLDDFDVDARKDLYIQQLLDQAFMVSDGAMRDYVRHTLAQGDAIMSKDLPIRNASDLLAAAHAIEVASSSNLSSEMQFLVTPLGTRSSSEYFSGIDDFAISLVDKQNVESVVDE